MLLYPTFNKSLFVSSNDGFPMADEKRIKLKTIKKIYQYEINENNFIVKGSKKLNLGLKELGRKGVIETKSKIYSINYNEAKGHLISGLIWKNKFIFSSLPLNDDFILDKPKLDKELKLQRKDKKI